MSRDDNNGRDRRRTLLERALELFADNGFAGTSVRQLARAAGIRESAIYHYFPSKEEVFFALINYITEQRLDPLEDQIETLMDKPLREVLMQLGRLVVAQLETPLERRFWRLVMAEGPRLLETHPALLRGLFKRPREALGRLFARLQERGQIRSEVEIDVVVLHFISPLVAASGVLTGGGRIMLDRSLQRFVRSHVAFMEIALRPPG